MDDYYNIDCVKTDKTPNIVFTRCKTSYECIPS